MSTQAGDNLQFDSIESTIEAFSELIQSTFLEARIRAHTDDDVFTQKEASSSLCSTHKTARMRVT